MATEPGRATLLPVVAVPRIDVSDLRAVTAGRTCCGWRSKRTSTASATSAAAADMHCTADELAADPTAAPGASAMARRSSP
ncbi:MAG: hypothetical protein R2699_17395 [Acidimicrobiales bacterium]